MYVEVLEEILEEANIPDETHLEREGDIQEGKSLFAIRLPVEASNGIKVLDIVAVSKGLANELRSMPEPYGSRFLAVLAKRVLANTPSVTLLSTNILGSLIVSAHPINGNRAMLHFSRE